MKNLVLAVVLLFFAPVVAIASPQCTNNSPCWFSIDDDNDLDCKTTAHVHGFAHARRYHYDIDDATYYAYISSNTASIVNGNQCKYVMVHVEPFGRPCMEALWNINNGTGTFAGYVTCGLY